MMREILDRDGNVVGFVKGPDFQIPRWSGAVGQRSTRVVQGLALQAKKPSRRRRVIRDNPRRRELEQALDAPGGMKRAIMFLIRKGMLDEMETDTTE